MMSRFWKTHWFGLLACGLLMVSAMAFVSSRKVNSTVERVSSEEENRVLRADVDRLKSVAPEQARAMVDVDYHFSNLWFAGRSENWPLAEFYWQETLTHLRWGVTIIPVRKDNAGQDVKLEEILKAMEQSPSMQMGDALAKRDAKFFEATYRSILEGCYSCHKAVDKPFLRPGIPRRPATSVIQFESNAPWPK